MNDMIDIEFKWGKITITHMLTEDKDEGEMKDSIYMFEAIGSL